MASSPKNTSNHDPHKIEGVNRHASKASKFPWIRVSFFVLICGFVIALQGPIPRKIWNKLKSLRATENVERKEDSQTPPEKPSPTKPEQVNPPEPPGLPQPAITAPADHTVSSGSDIQKMSKGFQLKTTVTVEKGNVASQERVKEESYQASYELKIKLPAPSKSLTDLKKVNADLGSILPGLEGMLSTVEVSPFFYQLYENKVNRLKANATKLNSLMTRHNFYDCETMLKLKSQSTGRRVLLVQAEMDVVSDGSDGDRLPTMPDKIVNSSYYQPMTSYGWRKRGATPNPLIAGWKNRIKKAEAEIARSDTFSDRRAWLKARIIKIKREIQDMEARSYLIADYDPFIVMPINMVTTKGDPFAASVGDYAVVIYGCLLYTSPSPRD